MSDPVNIKRAKPCPAVTGQTQVPVRPPLLQPRKIGAPSSANAEVQKSKFKKNALRKIAPLPTRNADIAAVLKTLLSSAPAYEQPAQSLVQKKAVRDLFAHNAVKALSHALIESIRNDRPDIFIAVLANFTRSSWKPFNPREPDIIHSALNYLETNRGILESRRMFVMHLAVRWFQVGHKYFDNHPLYQSISRRISNVLFHLLRTRKPSSWKEQDPTNSERLLFGMSGVLSELEVEAKMSRLRGDLSSKSIRGEEFAAKAAIMFAFLPYATGLNYYRDVTAELLARHEKSLHLLAPVSRFLLSSLLHRNSVGSVNVIGFDEKHTLLRFIPRESLVRVLRHLVNASPYASDTTMFGLIHLDMDAAKKGFVALLRNLRAPIGWLLEDFDTLPEKGIYARYREELAAMVIAEMPRMDVPRKMRGLAVLGMLRTETAKTYLRSASLSSNRELSQTALIAYADANKVPSFRKVPYRYKDGKGKDFNVDSLELYDIPISKLPKCVQETYNQIPIPKNLRPLLRKVVDWNDDGFIQGSYERYRLWSHVVDLYTKMREIHDNQKYARDPVLQLAAIALRGRLRELMPIYGCLPQVNYQKGTVRVGSRILTLKDTVGKYRPDVLFALGEAYSSVPLIFRDGLFGIGGDLGPLLFKVTPFDERFYGLYSQQEYRKYRKGWFRKEHERVINLNTLHKWMRVSKIIRIFKHEFGHAVDVLLNYRGTVPLRCRAQRPVLHGKNFARSKKDCPSWAEMGNFRSNWSDFDSLWRGRLKKAGVQANEAASLDRETKNTGDAMLLYKKSRALKYFESAYGATNSNEDFATMWEAYFTEVSPWSIELNMRTRADVEKISPVYWKFLDEINVLNLSDYDPPQDPE